jgi:hypothetical protein
MKRRDLLKAASATTGALAIHSLVTRADSVSAHTPRDADVVVVGGGTAGTIGLDQGSDSGFGIACEVRPWYAPFTCPVDPNNALASHQVGPGRGKCSTIPAPASDASGNPLPAALQFNVVATARQKNAGAPCGANPVCFTSSQRIPPNKPHPKESRQCSTAPG